MLFVSSHGVLFVTDSIRTTDKLTNIDQLFTLWGSDLAGSEYWEVREYTNITATFQTLSTRIIS